MLCKFFSLSRSQVSFLSQQSSFQIFLLRWPFQFLACTSANQRKSVFCKPYLISSLPCLLLKHGTLRFIAILGDNVEYCSERLQSLTYSSSLKHLIFQTQPFPILLFQCFDFALLSRSFLIKVLISPSSAFKLSVHFDHYATYWMLFVDCPYAF